MDTTEIFRIADTYCIDEIEKINVELKKRKKVLQQLAYLFTKLEIEKDKLHPAQQIKRTELKSAINDALEMDKFTEYLEGTEHTNDYATTLQNLNTNKIKFCTEPKSKSTKGFIGDNKEILPFEYLKAIEHTSQLDCSKINEEVFIGFIKGAHNVADQIEDKIASIISSNALKDEELEELKTLINTKIIWNRKLNEFAFVMNKLFNNQFINIPATGSSVVKSDLLHAHFKIEGKLGNDATKKSLKCAFNDLKDFDINNAKELSQAMIK